MNADMLSKIWFVHVRFIVIVGRPIYPLGHFSGYVVGTANADMLNKIWFVHKPSLSSPGTS